MTNRRGGVLVVTLAGSLVALSGCVELGEAEPRALLEVTSDAPTGGGSLDTIAVRVADADGGQVPADAADASLTFALGGADPTEAWVGLELPAAGVATLGAGPHVLEVVGLGGAEVLTRASVTVPSLAGAVVVTVHLAALPTGCDVDGDGYLDCGVSGCCDGVGAFSDCAPQDASVNPGVTEPACEPCGDVVDNDCDGGDVPCVDDDGDGLADCEEAAAGCGVGDATVGSGQPELCDGKDNDCDGLTDEEWLDLGDVCDGEDDDLCATGAYVCKADGSGRQCVEEGEGISETCNGSDDDCDGETDEDWPALGTPCDGDDVDVCEDGVWVCDGAGVVCGDDAAGSPETCDGEDDDCDGQTDEDWPELGTPCDGTDGDQCEDGLWVCGDDGVVCADDAATTAEACNGEDDDCDGQTDEDWSELGEPCDGIDWDKCEDGVWTCDGLVPECTDDAAYSEETCNEVDDDCDGQTDEDWPELGAPCDGTDWDQCEDGAWTCDGVGVVCVDDPAYQQELCNGVDDDCDGGTDENWTLGAACDGDDADQCADGLWICTGDGDAICSDDADSEPELCNGWDDDCDGQTDEGFPTLGQACDGPDADLCEEGAWICDGQGVVCDDTTSSQAELCNSIDDDCDGQTDEGFPTLGQACDGPDADLCEEGTWICDGEGVVCSDTTSSQAELCNGSDDDCDGQTDEGFAGLGEPCDGDDADACEDGLWLCDGVTKACTDSASSWAEVCNGVDDDCDGATDECDVVGCELAGGLCPEGGQGCLSGECVTADLDCIELDGCVAACGSSECEAACASAATPVAVAEKAAVDQCVANSGCPDYACLYESCLSEVSACLLPPPEGTADCAAINDCRGACQDYECNKACLASGSASTQVEWAAVAYCLNWYCVDDDPACQGEVIAGVCAEEYNACFGGGCVPDCSGEVCGDDGCGGSCGECAVGDLCVAGQCTQAGSALALCTMSDGAWASCGSGCGPATCANPTPGPSCPEVCVPQCACPVGTLWFDGAGCVAESACAGLLGECGSCDDGDWCTSDVCIVDVFPTCLNIPVDCPAGAPGCAPCPGGWCSEDGACTADGALRLGDVEVPEPGALFGRVEVFHAGQWGTVCDDGIMPGSDNGKAFAQVVCQQLGFAWGEVSADAPGVDGATPIWLDSVGCAGTEADLAACESAGWGVHDCGHSEDIAVMCYDACGMDAQCATWGPCVDAATCEAGACLSSWSECAPGDTECATCGDDAYCDAASCLADGTVRLGDGGRVEVWHDAEWGTVCDDGLSQGTKGQAFAHVVCTDLGFTGGVLVSNAQVPDGEGPTWLDQVACTGAEETLADCPANDWGVEDCGHSEDIGVACLTTCGADADCQSGHPSSVDTCDLATGLCTHSGTQHPCDTSPLPGSVDPDVTGCVCLFYPQCCTGPWSADCVFLALDLCGATCPCGDGSCGSDETCETCPEDCGACASDCCSEHAGIGCDDPVCEAAVSAVNPLCTFDLVGWDAPCAAIAADLCDVCSPCDGGLCPENQVDWCTLQWPPTIAALSGTEATVYGQVYEAGISDLSPETDVSAQLMAQLGWGPAGSDPVTEASGWTLVTAAANPGWVDTDTPDNDEYMATFTLPAPGLYDYAYRFSADGGQTWTWCDLDGTGNGYSVDQAGALASLAAPHPAPGQVFFTEIMQNPSATPDAAGEWFELFNASGEAFDLAGCGVADANFDAHTISGSLVIEPGGYLVLARNGDPTANGGVQVSYVYSQINLGNSSDGLILTCGGELIDEAWWDGGPSFPDPSGASMELDLAVYSAAANDNGGSWCVAVTPFGAGDLGTPGAPSDCDTSECGDGLCNGVETCSTCEADCGACAGETHCTDGVDDDGDGFTDCADFDCDDDLACGSVACGGVTFEGCCTADATLVWCDGGQLQSGSCGSAGCGWTPVVGYDCGYDGADPSGQFPYLCPGAGCECHDGLLLTAVLSGWLLGGHPKSVEVYACGPIADLSAWGLGSADDGGGSDGQEFTFPPMSLASGARLVVGASDQTFDAELGTVPDFTTPAVDVDGDDAIELWHDGDVVDVYGQSTQDGTGTAWEYTDSYAHRAAGTGRSAEWDPARWVIPGPHVLAGLSAAEQAPLVAAAFGTYVCTCDDASDPAASCDDGEACTTDACDAGAGCVHDPLTCPQGEPACNPCGGSGWCWLGSCVEDGALRLAEGGRVEVFHEGEWGTICDDGMYYASSGPTPSGAAFAGVVCSQLGMAGGVVSGGGNVPAGVDPMWLDGVQCDGEEPLLVSSGPTPGCQHQAWGSNNCSHNEDVGVTCVAQDVVPFPAFGDPTWTGPLDFDFSFAGPGHWVEGGRVTPLTSIGAADVHLELFESAMVCGAIPLVFSIDGAPIGSVTLSPGQVEADASFVFEPLTGGDVVLRVEQTAGLEDGCGQSGPVDPSTSTVTLYAQPILPWTTYSAQIQPVLSAKCTPCHTGAGLGGHNLGQSGGDGLDLSNACPGLTVGQCALQRVQDGSMPVAAGCSGDPALDAGNPACLTQEEQDLLEAWVWHGMPN